MSDDKKIIFSMVGVSKVTPQGKQIIKNIYLSFFYGAKIGIIGLNGSGKSTVMKIIAGLDKSYQGDVVFSPGYSVGYLPQEPELDLKKTVKEVVIWPLGPPHPFPRPTNWCRRIPPLGHPSSCPRPPPSPPLLPIPN